MKISTVPDELKGHFLGVGSLVEESENSAMEYILNLTLPYTYQRPSNPEEDMIRQFGSVLDGFEERGTFIYDPDFDEFQSILQDDESLLPERRYFPSIYEMKPFSFQFLKTQITAPSTMCYSIRGEDGRQHLTPQMFRFFCSLTRKILKGYVALFADSSETLIVCQDDPSFGFVTEAIDVGNVPGLSARFMMKSTDEVFPEQVIPAYHYCYDWRVLYTEGYHLIWESKPKIAHLDMVTYPPEIESAQAELINSFLQSGGGIALGILPNIDSAYSEPVLSYYQKSLRKTIRLLTEAGVNIDLLEENSMVSTQCGLSGATPTLSREIHENDKKYPQIMRDVCSVFR